MNGERDTSTYGVVYRAALARLRHPTIAHPSTKKAWVIGAMACGLLAAVMPTGQYLLWNYWPYAPTEYAIQADSPGADDPQRVDARVFVAIAADADWDMGFGEIASTELSAKPVIGEIPDRFIDDQRELSGPAPDPSSYALGYALPQRTVEGGLRESQLTFNIIDVHDGGMFLGGELVATYTDEGTSEDEKRGQMLVTKLYHRLVGRADDYKHICSRLGACDFRGEIAIAADAGTPFRVIREIMYTAGQAQFSSFHFIVEHPGPITLNTQLPVFTSVHPSIGPRDEALSGEEDADELYLTIVITDQGWTIYGANAVLGDAIADEDDVQEPTVPCLVSGCPTVESYDTKELARVLSKIKDHWPDEDDVILAPESRVEYETLVATMNAARVDPDSKEDGKPRTLFPHIVIVGGGRPGSRCEGWRQVRP